MVVDIPEWVQEEEVNSSLISAGVAPQELIQAGKSSISLRTSSRGRGNQMARLDVSYPAALALASVGYVVVGRAISGEKL